MHEEDPASMQFQLDRLDPDLAIQVVFSGISLNPSKMICTLSMVQQLMLIRELNKRTIPPTTVEQQQYDLVQNIFVSAYMAPTKNQPAN